MKLDSGILWTCELVNKAEGGNKPSFSLSKKRRHWYGERTVGYGRQYAAKGVNEQVDLLVRIHADRTARIGMYAVLGNGEQFRIDNVAQIVDDGYNSGDPDGGTGLSYTDLTLSRLEDYYDISAED